MMRLIRSFLQKEAKRQFQKKWLERWPWIQYDVDQGVMFGSILKGELLIAIAGQTIRQPSKLPDQPAVLRLFCLCLCIIHVLVLFIVSWNIDSESAFVRGTSNSLICNLVKHGSSERHQKYVDAKRVEKLPKGTLKRCCKSTYTSAEWHHAKALPNCLLFGQQNFHYAHFQSLWAFKSAMGYH